MRKVVKLCATLLDYLLNIITVYIIRFCMPSFTYFMFICYALNHIYIPHCQLLTITQFIIIKHLLLSLPQPTPKFLLINVQNEIKINRRWQTATWQTNTFPHSIYYIYTIYIPHTHIYQLYGADRQRVSIIIIRLVAFPHRSTSAGTDTLDESKTQ